MLDSSYFVTLYSHLQVYKGEIKSNIYIYFLSVYFHLATVNSRRMIVMITGVLKRLGTICRAASDGSKKHGGMSPVTIGNLYPHTS